MFSWEGGWDVEPTARGPCLRAGASQRNTPGRPGTGFRPLLRLIVEGARALVLGHHLQRAFQQVADAVVAAEAVGDRDPRGRGRRVHQRHHVGGFRADGNAGIALQRARRLVAERHRQADRVEAHRDAAVVLQAQVDRPAAIGAHGQLLDARGGSDTRRTGPDEQAASDRQQTHNATLVQRFMPRLRGQDAGQNTTAIQPRTEAAAAAMPGTKKPATSAGCMNIMKSMVAGDGIEPPTRGFSIPCSTN